MKVWEKDICLPPQFLPEAQKRFSELSSSPWNSHPRQNNMLAISLCRRAPDFHKTFFRCNWCWPNSPSWSRLSRLQVAYYSVVSSTMTNMANIETTYNGVEIKPGMDQLGSRCSTIIRVLKARGETGRYKRQHQRNDLCPHRHRRQHPISDCHSATTPPRAGPGRSLECGDKKTASDTPRRSSSPTSHRKR